MDNCILQSLGAADALHLLQGLSDLRTSSRVAAEQDRTARPPARDGFRRAQREGWIQVQDVPVPARADPAFARVRPQLGTTDAELLAWAKIADGVLVTDDTQLIRAAEMEGVAWLDLVDALADLVERGTLDRTMLRRLVHAIEFEDGRRFGPADLEELGLH